MTKSGLGRKKKTLKTARGALGSNSSATRQAGWQSVTGERGRQPGRQLRPAAVPPLHELPS